MSIRQWHIYVNISQKLKIDVHRPWNKQPREPLRKTSIIATPWKQAIAKAYLRSHECSVKDALYHTLPELKLRQIFQPISFVNRNPPEERVQVLFSDKEFSKLPDDSPNIFKKSNIYRYMERPSATLRNRKNIILDNFC